MWVIVEINNHAVLCYPQGDIMLWRNKDVALNYAVMISRGNPGVWQVQHLCANDASLVEKRTHGARLDQSLQRVVSEFPLKQTMYTKYME